MQEYALYGLPLMITEWGWWGDEVRGEYEVRDVVRWAEQSPLIERFFYFCMDDGMVPPFGLYRADGSPKPAASAFRDESRWVGSGTDPWSVCPYSTDTAGGCGFGLEMACSRPSRLRAGFRPAASTTRRSGW
jgi:hypothetical protein